MGYRAVTALDRTLYPGSVPDKLGAAGSLRRFGRVVDAAFRFEKQAVYATEPTKRVNEVMEEMGIRSARFHVRTVSDGEFGSVESYRKLWKTSRYDCAEVEGRYRMGEFQVLYFDHSTERLRNAAAEGFVPVHVHRYAGRASQLACRAEKMGCIDWFHEIAGPAHARFDPGSIGKAKGLAISPDN